VAWLAAVTAAAGVFACIPGAEARSRLAVCRPRQVQPVDPSHGGFLYGVSVVSSCSAWAVGQRTLSGGNARTLIERWNGRSWTIVTSPNPPALDDSLNAVAAISPTSAWAVGAAGSIAGERTLIARWNGRGWRQVASPSPGSSSLLAAVASAVSDGAWAVGTYVTATASKTLIEHWDGAWTHRTGMRTLVGAVPGSALSSRMKGALQGSALGAAAAVRPARRTR